MKPALVIGLTGPNAAGKGEAARLLVERGFVYHSLSDVVREEATARALDHSRENLIRVGNELRASFGPGVLAARISAVITSSSAPDQARHIVDSIRSPAEVAVLRTLPSFLLLGIDAPIAVRFDRSRARGRIGDGATFEEFARKEALENSADPAAQQLAQTLALADILVQNDGTIADLRARVEVALAGQL